MVIVACGIVTVVAVISGKICTKLASVSVVNADTELSGGEVADVMQLMWWTMSNDFLMICHKSTICQHDIDNSLSHSVTMYVSTLVCSHAKFEHFGIIRF